MKANNQQRAFLVAIGLLAATVSVADDAPAIYDLGGFPVRSEVQMGPIQMWSELESIEQKPAPAGTYEVPSGYSGCE